MTVSESRVLHFRDRLSTRHGITLSDSAFDKFCAHRCNKGASVQLSCRLGLHVVDFGGIVVAVLWDRKHGIPVTTLPDSAIVYSDNQVFRWGDGKITSVKGKPRKGRRDDVRYLRQNY